MAKININLPYYTKTNYLNPCNNSIKRKIRKVEKYLHICQNYIKSNKNSQAKDIQYVESRINHYKNVISKLKLQIYGEMPKICKKTVKNIMNDEYKKIFYDDWVIQKEIEALRKIKKNQQKSRKSLKIGKWIRCFKCGVITTEFYGKMTHCASCHKKTRRKYYENNKELQKAQVREWEKNNIKKRKKYSKKYYKENKTKIKNRQKEYFSKPKNKEKRRKYQNHKRKTDALYRLSQNLRGRTRDCLKVKKWKKTNNFKKYIGCELDELKYYLEEQFVDGMTWDNYGEWHIDHIVPLSLANNSDELYELCHFSNLQPLWAIDNIKKGAKLPDELN